MYEQLSLPFLDKPTDKSQPHFQINMQKSGFDYQEIDIGDITFKSGQLESVHRWYRLTPSYSPNLVRFFIKEFQITPEHFVLDPFSGRGTTVIECQKQGIKSLGIEINPLLQQVGYKSLLWQTKNLDLIAAYLREIKELIQAYQDFSLETVVNLLDTQLPIIHNVFRWWQPQVLKNLLICRQVMLKSKYTPVENYLWMALNKACLDCANIHRNHPTITFDDQHQREINVNDELHYNLKIITDDLASLSHKEISFSNYNSISLGNSTHNLHNQIKNSVDFIITSPPYPNRYSYVHQTRPQLYFMEVLDHVTQATEIDLQAIGGTWGRATSVLQNNLISVPDEIKPYLCYYEELKNRNILMCNYATKYFIDMWQHIQSLKSVKSTHFQGVYVVGNSRLSEVEIFTEAILAQLFIQAGFQVKKIICFRKRGGKKHLYETAIWIKS